MLCAHINCVNGAALIARRILHSDMDKFDMVCYKLLSKIQDTYLILGRPVLVIYFMKMFQI